MANRLETLGYQSPEYQRFDDLEFFRDDNDPNATEINIAPSIPDDEFEEEVKAMLKRKLGMKCWWLNDKFTNERGLPKEQISIEVRAEETAIAKVDVYNFGDPLSDQHKAQIESVVAAVAKINAGEAFNKVKYIFIEKADEQNKLTGEPTNGEATLLEYYQAIQIYPHGLRQERHRTGLPSNFEATVAHEIGHAFEDKHLVDWERQFGWKNIDTVATSPGGRQLKKTTDEPCVSGYAAYEPAEDLADSIAVYLLDPELLRIIHPGKLQFLEDRLQVFKEDTDAKNESRNAADVKLPGITNPVKYKVTRNEPRFLMKRKK